MKKFLLFLLFCIGASISYSQAPDLKKYNLFGEVKSCKTLSFSAKKEGDNIIKTGKGWESAEKVDRLIEFNNEGKVENISYYDGEGELVRKNKFVYIDKKLSISETKYASKKYKYNENGNVSVVEIMNRAPGIISASNIDELAEGSKSIHYMEYNENGQLAIAREKDEDGQIVATITYEYDSSGLLTKEIYDDGDYKDWYDYSYAENGRLIQKKWSDNDEGTLENEYFIYDTNGEKVEEIWENYDGGEIEGKIIYKFENGNEKEVTEYDFIDETEIKWTYSYTYDEQGNWIKKVSHTFKDEWFIEERIIEYY